MNRINNNELKEIKGGFGWIASLITISGIIFLCGVIKGITQPNKCN